MLRRRRLLALHEDHQRRPKRIAIPQRYKQRWQLGAAAAFAQPMGGKLDDVLAALKVLHEAIEVRWKRCAKATGGAHLDTVVQREPACFRLPAVKRPGRRGHEPREPAR